MKTNKFIKWLKSHGVVEITKGNSKHRKFDRPGEPLERPIIISRSSATKEVKMIFVKQAMKVVG